MFVDDAMVFGSRFDPSGLNSGFARAQQDGRAFSSRMKATLDGVKSAGSEVGASFKNAIGVARSELSKFAGNKDVKVAVEIAREKVDEAWIRTRQQLQRFAAATGLKVAAAVVEDKAQTARTWLAKQRQALVGSPLVHNMKFGVWFAKRELDHHISTARAQIESLQRFRVVRIGLAAVNGISPVARAAMATIAPISRLALRGLTVPLHLAAGGFHAGVNLARSAIDRLGGGLRSLTRMVTSPIGAFVSLGAAILATRALINSISEKMESIDAGAKLADRLGMSTEALAALKHQANLAGADIENVTLAIQHQQKVLTEGARGAKNNPLTKLDLDPKALINLPSDEALGIIADRLKEIENQSQRSTAAAEIFGMRAGPKLMALLMEGSAGIEAARAEAEKLGLTYNRVDAAKVELANDAISRAKSAIDGIVQALAIELSPVIQGIAERFTSAATEGEGMGKRVSAAAESMARGIAYVTDYLELLKAGFKLLQSGVTWSVYGIIKVIDALGEKIVKLANLTPGVNLEWTSVLDDYADGLAEDAKRLSDEAGKAFDNFMTGANSDKVANAFGEMRRASQQAAEEMAARGNEMRGAFEGVDEAIAAEQEKVTESLKEMRRELEQFDMADSQKRMMDFKGLNPDVGQLEEYKKLLDQLDFKQKSKDARDSVTQWAEGLKTPLERLEKKLEELHKAKAEGLIDEALFAQGIDAAKRELKTLKDEKNEAIDMTPKIASFIRSGSQDAYKLQAEIAAQIQGRKDNNKIPLDQLEEAKAQTAVLERIEQKLDFTGGDWS